MLLEPDQYTAIHAEQLWHLSPSALKDLRARATTPAGRSEIIEAAAKLALIAEPTSIADLDDLYAIGVQLASAWPTHPSDEGVLRTLFASNPAGIALRCGFLGNPFEDIFERMDDADLRRFPVVEPGTYLRAANEGDVRTQVTSDDLLLAPLKAGRGTAFEA